jgi:hypothetical protein
MCPSKHSLILAMADFKTYLVLFYCFVHRNSLFIFYRLEEAYYSLLSAWEGCLFVFRFWANRSAFRFIRTSLFILRKSNQLSSVKGTSINAYTIAECRDLACIHCTWRQSGYFRFPTSLLSDSSTAASSHISNSNYMNSVECRKWKKSMSTTHNMRIPFFRFRFLPILCFPCVYSCGDTASGILRDGLLGIEVQCHKNELFSMCRTESWVKHIKELYQSN